MTKERFQEIEREGAIVDLSARAMWRVTGNDRLRYLNGQVTQDVRKASDAEAVYACVTNAKGRIDGDIFIHAISGEALILDAEPGLRESLFARLEKYVVADDVVIEDLTGNWSLFHGFGAAAQCLTQAGTLTGAEKTRVLRSNRFGVAGYDLWVEGARDAPVSQAPGLTPAETEVWRICHGLPRWPQELNADSFPQEAGLESRAMDFSKGCYVGQEVLSRIKTSGRMPRKLVGFQVVGTPIKLRALGADDPPERLWVRSAEGVKEAGTVTSACLHPALDRMVGLAYVRQGLEREHSLLIAPEGPPNIFVEVEITAQ